MTKKLLSEIPVLKGDRITLKALTADDAGALREFTQNEDIYRMLPTFLFEKKYDSAEYVISRLYDECIKQSLILGVFLGGSFCGLAEIYSYRAVLSKASAGYRLLPQYWGQGIATEALGLMVKYVLEETDVNYLTASTMLENRASAKVLKKNGFKQVAHALPENWGFKFPVLTDKWLRTAEGHRRPYRFQT